MYFYYIKGKNTFLLKEEIKKFKPQRKDFNKWWIFSDEFKSWHLEVPNNVHTKEFDLNIQSFCKENDLELEILEFTKPLTKSIKDFKTEEGFFSYLHKNNNKNFR
ncbi:hypothetical protein [Halarcobacter sp.]|uniref:hypothetical protein n=1 Tax=Halarcobacter sp. TaxID=2321133 RepID=UPI002AABA212|nr:hypothetical protein [Halarcobacter sp.]